ncbi:LDCC motif putative metal-binding protein [Petroclostridium sp. X23]|nr:LDCC motif putative metal-binding protein [Petroclostridium sp. X23]WHH60004.1 LDCC motif putative metal-binding protein [Petroclostridium sp. X23]
MFKWFEKLIEKIAKANGDSFQGQKLDCCELNKNGNSGGTKK